MICLRRVRLNPCLELPRRPIGMKSFCMPLIFNGSNFNCSNRCILLPFKKCESAYVGQPLNLRPACIAKLFKFNCFGADFAWLKFMAPPWHFSLFLNGPSIVFYPAKCSFSKFHQRGAREARVAGTVVKRLGFHPLERREHWFEKPARL
jgi:hypothetical protein